MPLRHSLICSNGRMRTKAPFTEAISTQLQTWPNTRQDTSWAQRVRCGHGESQCRVLGERTRWARRAECVFRAETVFCLLKLLLTTLHFKSFANFKCGWQDPAKVWVSSLGLSSPLGESGPLGSAGWHFGGYCQWNPPKGVWARHHRHRRGKESWHLLFRSEACR